MIRAAVVVFVALLIGGQHAHAERLSCATLIAVGKPTSSREAVIRVRLDMILEWSRMSADWFDDNNLEKVIVGCVADPEATVNEVIRHIIRPVVSACRDDLHLATKE